MSTPRIFLSIGLIGLLFTLAQPSANAAVPENLLGVSFDFDKKEVTIQVVSNGCTEKGHFSFEMKNDMLTINRKQKDECKRLPEKVNFTFSLKDAGIDPNKPFKIENKFIVNEMTANIR